MLIPNSTGHVAHVSRPVAHTDPSDEPTHVVNDYDVIAWQERPDGVVVPLVVGPRGLVVDATSLEGFEGLYPAVRAIASAEGWFAEFVGEDGTPELVPLAAWATRVGGVVGLIGGEPGEVRDGTLLSGGDRDLFPVSEQNFVRYVHQSERPAATD